MKDEIKLLSELKANEFVSYFSDEIWLKHLSYLADIFENFNNLNPRLQEKGTNIIQRRDNLQTFTSNLQNWRLKAM